MVTWLLIQLHLSPLDQQLIEGVQATTLVKDAESKIVSSVIASTTGTSARFPWERR
jgi:hypothetical protein